jgi:hypothetical protein
MRDITLRLLLGAQLSYNSTLNKEELHSSKISVNFYQNTQRSIQECNTLLSHLATVVTNPESHKYLLHLKDHL